MNKQRSLTAYLVFVALSFLGKEVEAYDDRNPLGSPLIPYRKVCEAPDWRFNDRTQNRLIDDQGVVLASHQKRCTAEGKGQPPDKCARAPDAAMRFGCINDVERRWALWAGLYVMCDPVAPVELYHVCPCSCFAPETRILVTHSSSESSIWRRSDQVTRDDTIVTLSDGATVETPAFEGREILYTTSGEEHADLVRIVTASGVVLDLTQHHAVLLSDGRMVAARELKPGDDAVDWQGNPVPIIKIERKAPGGQVFNLAAAGTPKTSHLILAEGILVGDLLWQNSLGTELGEVAVRRGPILKREQP